MPAVKPPEFRRHAVERARRGEQPIATVARDLGISTSTLRRWMEFDAPGAGGRRGQWDRGLGVLLAHVAAGGTPTPPTHLVVDGYPLGRWVGRRRELFRAGRLTANRVAALEAVPGWSWGRTQQDGFEQGLDHLQAHVGRHGTANVSHDEVTDGFRLGQWVARRRQSQVAGELRPEWAAALEALPGWQWTHPQAMPWAEGVSVLGDWVVEHGSAAVPPQTTYQGFALGEWVASVRRMHQRGTLGADRVAELEGLPGWGWGSRVARFGQGLALLRAHQETTGSASPEQFYVHPSGFTLGAWVGRVRSLHRAGALPAERVAQLQSVPGWVWNPKAQRWQVTVAAVQASATQHGGLRSIPRDTRVDGEAHVARWTTYQRHRHHRGLLTPQETAALEAVPGWWWTPAPDGHNNPV